MNLKKEANSIIKILESGGFHAECPCCQKPVILKNAGLFYLDDFSHETLELYNQQKADLRERKSKLKELRKAISSKSEVGAKADNTGFILERLAPTMQNFRFDRNDCRSLFDPIDYIIFEGLNKNGSVSNIIFTDIKTGDAKLKHNQKEIKNLVETKKIEWDIYQTEDSK